MRTNRLHIRVATLACAVALLLQMPPVMAGDQRDNDHNSRPVEVTFTKWFTGAPAVTDGFGDAEHHGLFTGVADGGAPGTFAGEVLQNQPSRHPDLQYQDNGPKPEIARLEAIYKVQAGDGSFTALIHGGSNNVTGVGLLDGTILAGWRTGAPVHVEFQRIPGTPGCVAAPIGATCWVGTIRVGRAPRD